MSSIFPIKSVQYRAPIDFKNISLHTHTHWEYLSISSCKISDPEAHKSLKRQKQAIELWNFTLNKPQMSTSLNNSSSSLVKIW